MEIKEVHLDLAKFVWIVVAGILLVTGKVDGWVIFLFILWGIEYKISWEK